MNFADFANLLGDAADWSGKERVEVDATELRALVRKSPKAAIEYVREVLILSADAPYYLAMAMNVATAYAMEFEDRDVMATVVKTAELIGREDVLEEALMRMRLK